MIRNPYIWMLSSLIYLIFLSYLRFFWTGSIDLDLSPVRLDVEISTRTLQVIGFCLWILGFIKFIENFSDDALNKSLLWKCLCLHLVAVVALPMTSNDIFSNFAYGELYKLGMNPDRFTPADLPNHSLFKNLVSPVWYHTPSVYGPLINLLNAHLIQNTLLKTMIVYKVFYLTLSLLMVLGTYCYLKRNAEQQSLIFILFACNPLFIWDVSGQAHNDALLMLCLLGFVLGVKSKQQLIPLLCLLLGILFKMGSLPLIILYFAYLIFQAKQKWVLILLPACIAILFLYPEIYEKLKIVLVSPNNQNPETARITNSISFLFYFLGGLISKNSQFYFYKTYWYLSAGVLVLWGGKLCFTPKDRDQMLSDCFSYLFVLLYLFSPSFQPWYLLWLLPFAFCYKTKESLLFVTLLPCLYMIFYPIFWSIIIALMNLVILWYFIKIKMPKPVLATSQSEAS